ncbi:HlyD family secretion protein [Celeribacter sp.]|uniref:HlyD family secretion protein n=1 Tax=Celeribacter sp. TaxID=1890673 RepID=UPI003A8D4979
MADLPSWLVSIIAAVYPGINPPPPYMYDGYVEADFVYAAPAATGRIVTLVVSEGEAVSEGALLFALDDGKQQATLRSAQAGSAQAQAQLENLATGAREAEAEVLRASLEQARVALNIAQTRLERSEALFERGSVATATVEDQRAAVDEAAANVMRLEAELRVAELPARDAQRLAAEAAVDAAAAQVDLAQSALDDRRVYAPVSGQVERVYYETGEVAGAAAPVVSLLQVDAMTALFFVPEADRADLSAGDVVAVSCEGCAEGLTATITRMASDPQYTPPILYTAEQRGRLVYRVEAKIEAGAALRPGQPISVDATQAGTGE